MTKSQKINFIKEACVDSLISAQNARNNGANRLELCARLDLDGLTPSLKTFNAIKSNIDIPIKVMIRHRGGDFEYDKTVEEIKARLIITHNIVYK